MTAIIILGILLQACFIGVEKQGKYLPAVILKGSASLCFLLLGIRCAALGVSDKWVIWGLVFGMAGDILLNLRYLAGKMGQKVFLIGILIFMLGHIMYLITLLQSAPDPMIPVIIGVVIAAGLLYWILSSVTAAKAFKIFGVFYIGAVTLMAVTAVWNYVHAGSTSAMMFAIGGVLFLASDVILIFNTFTDEATFARRAANLSLYYVGQLLIAASLLFM